MSGHGAPTPGTVDGSGLIIDIVASSWHPEIMDGLIAGATRVLEADQVTQRLVRVTGSFELPIAAQGSFDSGADAVVALGVIIRGGTPHFEYVAAAATDGLSRVTLDSRRPIGFGLLTVDDEQQGLDRAGLPGSPEDKGAEAADAAVRTALLLREMLNRA